MSNNLEREKMLLIEIILTIFVWRKGWKWRSLLPVGIAFLAGILIGMGAGMAGGNIDNIGPAVLLDLFAIIALIVMLVKGPKEKSEIQKTE